jgi:hypothetical protein
MMNAERMFVGIQGLGIAEASYQRARDYAGERLQGRSVDGARGPVAIIEHPDVRRMLMTIKSQTDSARALATWTALEMEKSARAALPEDRERAESFVALLTPVIKAALTDIGFESAVLAQQVFGGHGYIRETGIEQFVRDARITQIYEGTNGVQAIDLVMRKLPMQDGRVIREFLADMRAEVVAFASQPGISREAHALVEAIGLLERMTHELIKTEEVAARSASATDYLRFFSLVALGWMSLRMAGAANLPDVADQLRIAKTHMAQFFIHRILPKTLSLSAAIEAGPASVVAPKPDFL